LVLRSNRHFAPTVRARPAIKSIADKRSSLMLFLTSFRRGLPLLLSAAALAAPFAAPAQPAVDAADFPAAAVRFLDAEMPAMDAAVAARDRSFFEGAMARAVEFADAWGFKSGANPALARFQPCVGAVS